MYIRIPRLMLAAPHGRSGKTTLTMGLLAALRARGVKAQPFKKGPDFIDPGWLGLAAGRPCFNLDCFMMTPEGVLHNFAVRAQQADLALVEGAMGLYDGLDLAGSNSSAELAKLLQTPVLLVVDCTRMTRSVAALVSGYRLFDREVHVEGVILNRVAGSRHEKMLREAVEAYTGLPVVGILPKNKEFGVPDRHLGLIPAAENQSLHHCLDLLAGAVDSNVDWPKLMEIAGGAPLVKVTPGQYSLQSDQTRDRTGRAVSIGVFRDRVFSFYYPENLQALQAAGATLVWIDSLAQQQLPSIDGLYIGGGFPEEFAAELAANEGLRRAVLAEIEAGLPVYAECGGLMYLCRTLHYRGVSYPMVGALPADIVMEHKPQGHGYTIMEVCGQNGYLRTGQVVRGHEFHHSRVINLDEGRVGFAYRVLKGYGVDGRRDGLVYKNVMAAYNHLHVCGTGEWVKNLVSLAAERQVAANRVILAKTI